MKIKKKNVAILISGKGSNMLALLKDLLSKESILKPVLVVADRKHAEGLKLAKKLGIRTERDGSLSLSESDFQKAFAREPILFDVMVNSLARSSNPSVEVTSPSKVLSPKGGVYNFVENATDGNSATLGGIALTGNTTASGMRQYAGVSGDISGLRLTSVGGSAQTATIYYGQSFLSKITDYIKDVTGSVGILATSSSKAGTSISEYAEDQADLEEKIAKMTERYMSQFSAMESAVTGFKKTGEFLTGFIDSLNPKD